MDASPDPAARRFALVGPRFFAYVDAIRETLERKGHVARYHDERHANTVTAKLLYRLGWYARFPARKRQHLDEVARRVLADGATDVLLVATEAVDRPFVQRLVDAGVRVHGYTWDSLENKPAWMAYMDLLGGRGSFDPQDCATHGFSYIPLFGEAAYADARHAREPGPPVHDIAFCGTLHSNRADHLAALQAYAHRRGLQLELLLFFHSKLLLALKGLARPSHFRFLSRTRTTGFSKATIAATFAASRYVFDVPHPDQRGLTARTFEVLRSGSRLITFNRNAGLLPPALAGRVVVIDRLSDLDHIDIADTPPAPELDREDDYFLSIDRFVDQLLELTRPEAP